MEAGFSRGRRCLLGLDLAGVPRFGSGHFGDTPLENGGLENGQVGGFGSVAEFSVGWLGEQ